MHRELPHPRKRTSTSHTGMRVAAVALLLVVLAFASTSRFGAGSPSAATAPSLRSASSGQEATSSSVTVSRPAGTSAGDVLVAAVTARVDAGSAMGGPSGWTLIRRDDCSGSERTVLSQALYYKVAGGSEPSAYTFSSSTPSGVVGSVLAYSGVDTANPIDGSSGRYTRNSVYVKTTSVAPSGDARLLVASIAHSGAEEPSGPAEMTRRAGSVVSAEPTATLAVADQALTGSGPSGEKAAKVSSPPRCSLGALVLLRPSGNATPPPAQCADTRDNDGDSLVDLADPGCSSPSDNDETNAAPPPPPQGEVTCLVSNRSQWNLAGTNCALGTELRFTNQQFRCDRPLSQYGPLPLKLVWNFTGNPDFGDQGHLDFLDGCRGDGNDNTIDVIVISNADGVRLGAAGGAGKFRTAGPTDIQITGNFDCGPLGSSAAHQDGWQFHPDHLAARLDIVNGTSGNWAAGTSTCIGAGGAIFWSNDYDVDVYGGRYVTCNKGLFGAGQSRPGNEIVGAGFRTGRNDGTDPKCVGYYASDPCLATSNFRLENVICQRWDRSTRTWRDVAPSAVTYQ